MPQAKEDNLPLSIIASSRETFDKLESLVRKLPEDFLKQFESVETSFFNKLKSKPFYGSGDFIVVGVIQYVSQDEDKVDYHSSKLNRYTVRSEVMIDDKKVELQMEILMSEKTPLNLRCRSVI